eukprot:4616763-Prymnesium_polylepis.1
MACSFSSRSMVEPEKGRFHPLGASLSKLVRRLRLTARPPPGQIPAGQIPAKSRPAKSRPGS